MKRAKQFKTMLSVIIGMLVLLSDPAVLGENVLLGGFDNNEGVVVQDSSVAGDVALTMTGHNSSRDYAGVTSGAWGTEVFSPAASTNDFSINQAFGDLGDFTLTLQNNLAEDPLCLDQIHWASYRNSWKSETTWELSATGDIASGGTSSGSLGEAEVWTAFDVDLSGVLSTNILNPGQSVTFLLAWTGTSGAQEFKVDNLALSGSVVEEEEPSAVIVQWGALGEETNVVSSTQYRNNAFGFTYDSTNVVSPEQGASYYSDSTDRSPIFYGANSIDEWEVSVKSYDSGDVLELTPTIDVNETYSAMVVWQDFLDVSSWIDTFSISIEKRYWDTDSHYRYLVQKASGEWYAGPARTFGTRTDQAGLLPWYAFTPFVDGTATIASARSEIDLTDITALGFYFESENVSDASHIVGATLSCFQATSSTTAPAETGGVESFDTGYTVIKVCNGMRNGESVIVGASYEGTVLALDYDGNRLWTNALTGYMVRDLWCDDLDDDGTDEVLAAVADGSVHCLNLSDGTSFWEEAFQPNEVPMNAVCTIRGATETYVACGGFDNNFYWLNADGTLHRTVASSTYSDQMPWGGAKYYLDRYIGYAHSVNFLRPLPQSDGTDHLIMHGYRHMQFNGPLYEFEPLSAEPTKLSVSSGIDDSIGSFEIADPDGDSNYSIYMGGNSFSISVAELDLGSGINYNHKEDFTDPFKTYRFSAMTDIPDEGSYQHLVLCGNKMVLLSPQLATKEGSILMPYAPHHMWNDRDKNRIILSSCQSGGSAVHVIDPSSLYWKQELLDLYSPGKMVAMSEHYNSIQERVDDFVRPSWEREPDQLIEASGNVNHPVAVALREKYGVSNPLFMSFAHTTNVQTQEWKNTASASSVLPLVDPADEPYLHRSDNGITYARTQQELLDNHFQPAIDCSEQGLSFRGGHGNDPYYYQPATLLEVIDRSYAKDLTRKTVLSWAEIQSTSDDFIYPLERLFLPIAERLKTSNGILSFNNKHIFWNSTVHKEAWESFISGEVKEVFRPVMEESTSKTAELSLSGRIGLWASGCFDGWGTRTTRDNTSFDRAREIAAQIVPNHFLRHMVYRLAYGASFSHSSYTDADYQSLAWKLVASGALYLPRRDEIVSFSPVHISITDPDERYIAGNEIAKWTTYYDEDEQAANPMVFGRFEACWMAGKNTEWDFSRYAAGVIDRRQNFIPPFPHGLVLNTPVEHGMHVSSAEYRTRLVDNLHPMYQSILTEHITDGRDYIASDSDERYGANSAYFQTVTNDLNQGAAQLPVVVSGDVAWVCAQTASTHLRLTLVDSGYLNPKERTATVAFHTVTPVALTDVLTGETLPFSEGTAEISVPLGMFRFIDIELSQPFYPQPSTWEAFVTTYQLAGDTESDSDGDGVSDYAEFYLGGNPQVADATEILPQLEFDGDTARFIHQGMDSDDVQYLSAWTEDLVDGLWQTNWGSISITANSTSAYSEFEYVLNLSDKSNAFFKVDFGE